MFVILFYKKGGVICKVIDLLFPLIISFAIVYIYFGGEDWFSYYNDYILKPIYDNMNDITFLLIIKSIYFFTFNSIVMTIYFFFVVCFYILRYLFICDDLSPILGGIKKYYIFLSLTIFTLGPNLVMEQLRQFLSVIFLIPFIIYYLSGNKKKSYIYMILALFTHSSSILFIAVTFFIAYITTKRKLFYLLLILGFISYSSIQMLSILHPYDIPFISTLSDKYIAYRNMYGRGGIGYIYILNCIFIFLYFCFFDFKKNTKIENGFSMLFIASSFIYLFSLPFPFVTRFLSTGIVIYIIFLSIRIDRFCDFKINLSNLYCVFFILMISISYYYNYNAPFKFITISRNDYQIPLTKQDLNNRLNVIYKSIINRSKAVE